LGNSTEFQLKFQNSARCVVASIAPAHVPALPPALLPLPLRCAGARHRHPTIQESCTGHPSITCKNECLVGGKPTSAFCSCIKRPQIFLLLVSRNEAGGPLPLMSPAGVTKASDTEQKAARPQITTLQMGLLHRPSPPLQKLRVALPSAGSAGLPPPFLMTLEQIPLRPSEQCQMWPLSPT
jgi:hypothetical protein